MLASDDNNTNFLISDLIVNRMDTGDELMRFMKIALVDESNLTDKALSPTTNKQENNITNENLYILINELKNTHCQINVLQRQWRKIFYDTNLWRIFIVSEKNHATFCQDEEVK